MDLLSASGSYAVYGHSPADTVDPRPDQPTLGPRAYKSRQNRPCDFCRARKAACKIAVAPPCALCHSYGRECTFVSGPQKRKRNASQAVSGDGQEPQRRRTDHADSELRLNGAGRLSTSSSPPSNSSPPASRSPVEDVLLDDDIGELNTSSRQVPGAEEAALLQNTDQPQAGRSDLRGHNVNNSVPRVGEFSLAELSTKNAALVGETGEADPYLCRRYRYENDECVLSNIVYRRIPLPPPPSLTDDAELGFAERPVIFMLPDDNLANTGEPRSDNSVLEAAQTELKTMVPTDVGVRLLKLFFRFVYPYFPVLSRTQMLAHDISTVLLDLPLSLQAGIYATSLPFLLYDDILATTIIHSPPPAARLYRICWLAIVQETHTPKLATLQACLLLLQRAPSNKYIMDTPFQWSLTAWTVSLAYLIGLGKSSVGWLGLPKWERRLRGRLWWATYVLDKWSFFGAGTPSHIRNDDFDVELPILAPNAPSTVEGSPCPSTAPVDDNAHDLLAVPSHFYHLVQLTTILSDTFDTYYSIRATSLTTNNFSLSVELAKPLRVRLKTWKDSFTASNSSAENSSPHLDTAIFSTIAPDTLDGNASLVLAYIVTVMALYRALLRAVDNLDSSLETSAYLHAAARSAVLKGAKECGKEAVEFVEDLSRGDVGVWDAFWHSCGFYTVWIQC
ncbi:hypothetical protein A1O1_06949 [Capronia coronata CBS 617.96]|uniref:Zn(2)-C6 fungal-type domain-containing protein n=1 Tax=Capronia coronata CBS 617.96 TaxID=1182541 RepID=W9XSZ2_9EURO|nr:uncharacterized protein A1O1_06949 [Capronia coronata CBS 617.96]EXJ83328.1 hypothetical protein A1O1_06949 [Capronia coronata CBS 617.96]